MSEPPSVSPRPSISAATLGGGRLEWTPPAHFAQRLYAIEREGRIDVTAPYADLLDGFGGILDATLYLGELAPHALTLIRRKLFEAATDLAAIAKTVHDIDGL